MPSYLGSGHVGIETVASFPAPLLQSLMNHRKRRGGDRQLRGDLGPVLQAADEGAGRKLVGNDDLIAGVQPDAFELRSGEQTVDVIRGYHHTVRTQYKSVVQV